MIDPLAVRRSILDMAYKGQAGHIPSAFSIVEILIALYDSMLVTDGEFILSKGHGCLALYAVLAENGIIPKDHLDYFISGGVLGGHPGTDVPGISYATGSLGHGLGVAVGMAFARRIRKKTVGRIYVLLGDGECQEGSVYESAALAAEHELPITAIIDVNEERKLNLRAVFRALGWTVYNVTDGHNVDTLISALSIRDNPTVILAQTFKGRGCASMEVDPKRWHHKIPTEAEYEALLGELQ